MSDKPEAKDPKDAKEGEAPAKKKGGGKLFIILGVVLVLLGGGGAGAFFMLRTPADAAAEGADAHKEEEKEANGIVNFEPFVVNLADPGGRRFLRINVRLVVPEEEEAEHIEENKVIQTRLRARSSSSSPNRPPSTSRRRRETALKKEISERAHHILKDTEVADVLFSDFVIQY